MDGYNEQELIRAAQRGDKEAFLTLHRAHVDVLYRTLLARIGHVETVEDVVQETFLRALAALPSFVPQRTASFRAWLFRIAMNLYISQYRKQKRVVAVEPEVLSTLADLTPTLSYEERGNWARRGEPSDIDRIFLRGAIEKLDEKDQEVIMLRYFSDLSYEEIATALGLSVSAVGVRLHRAVGKLRNSLATATSN